MPSLKGIPPRVSPRLVDNMARKTRTNYPPRTCQECGDPFVPVRVDQLFCVSKRPKCKVAANTRALARASTLYREMMWFVRKGLSKQEQGQALSMINHTVRQWRDQDEARGIPLPPAPDRVRLERTQARVALGFIRKVDNGDWDAREYRRRTGFSIGEARELLARGQVEAF